jgi:exopolyphosphatase / guanosine-5'-triphosphate,3'-diphosphate pyrophosphatase
VGYIISAAMPAVLPQAPLTVENRLLTLALPPRLAQLNSDRLGNRMRQLARLLGCESRTITGV